MNTRVRKFTLALSAAAPLALVASVVLPMYAADRRDELLDDLRQRNTAALYAVERHVEAELGVLRALANSSALERADWAALHREAARLKGARSAWRGVVLTADGQTIVNTRQPFAAPQPPRPPPSDAEDGGQAHVSDVAVDWDGSAIPHVTLTLPVPLGGGRYALSASIGLHALSETLREQPLPPGWSMVVLDGERRVVAHSGARSAIDPRLAAFIDLGGAATGERLTTSEPFETADEDGLPVVAAALRSATTPWLVVTRMPKEAMADTMQHAVRDGVLITGVALALAAVSALLLVRALARREEAEQRLGAMQAEAASWQHISDVTAHFPGAIYRRLMAPDGAIRFAYMSPGALRFFGGDLTGASEAAAEALYRRALGGDGYARWREAAQRSADTLEPFWFEGEMCLPDGGRTWVRSTANVRRLPDGSVCWDGVFVDISELKEAAGALRAAKETAEQANLAKSRFMAAASHDLRQPVQSLMMFMPLMLARADGPDEEDIARMMEVSLDALKGILDSMLDISRIDAGSVAADVREVAAADVLEALDAAHAPLAAAKGLRWSVDCADGLMIRTDPDLLGRILGNLVSNAIKYTAQGDVAVACHAEGGALRIEVRDTGIGIPEDAFAVVFDEFTQLGNPERDREKGLGLGLAIVQRLARLLGHAVTLSSTLGQGSAFSVTVPITRAFGVSAGPVVALPTVAPGQIARIVFIEDDRLVRDAIAATLRRGGFEVVAAASTGEAVALLRGAPAPDFILSDYQLADGRTGIEAIERLRAVCKRPIPALLLTGDIGPVCVRRAEAIGCGVLHKPVRPERLVEILGGRARTAKRAAVA